MGTGQVTLSVNSQDQVPKGMPMQRIPNSHQTLLSPQHILQIFRIRLQMKEFS